MAVAIFLTGDVLRECALSSRTSAFDQGRRLRRLTRLVAITHLSRPTWPINTVGRGRVESDLPHEAKTHFAFRVDIWDDTGDSIVEHVAGVDDFEVAEATYRAAVARWPAGARSRTIPSGGQTLFRCLRWACAAENQECQLRLVTDRPLVRHRRAAPNRHHQSGVV
jgi:hypothetical protein